MANKTISWSLPQKILNDPTYTKIFVYKGKDENDLSTYIQLPPIDRWVKNGSDFDYTKEITSYTDSEYTTEYSYYFVKYGKEDGTLSNMLLTFFEFSPKETRLCGELAKLLDPIIASIIQLDGTFRPMETEDYMTGIKLALGYFNSYIPGANFSLANYPAKYEGVLLIYAQLFTIVNKGLGLSLRDFSYSDNGISLNQSFAPAIQSAIQNLNGLLGNILTRLSLEFSIGADDIDRYSVGSYPWAIGTGGRLNFSSPDLLGIYKSITVV